MNNPINAMKQLLTKFSPQQAVINMLGSNTNPMIKNLVDMAKNGNSKGVENFARNLYKEQGKDFDKEFAEFMKNFK